MHAAQIKERPVNIARDAVRRRAVPGLALALVEDGAPASEQVYGLADRERRVALSSRHVFQAASLAKCVTAWTVARLAEHGRIDFDAPIERYTTRWRLPASGFDHARITARRLLSHTAGLSLPDYPGFEPDRALPRPEASLSGDSNGGGELRAIEPAGVRFRYSGGGYGLLALAIEEITGEPFAGHVARSVLEPLGMSNSTLDQHSSLTAGAATGHDENGGALPFYRFDGTAAAGLFSTVTDLARFAAAHLDGPRGESPGRGVLTPRSVAILTAPLVRTQQAGGLWDEYGLGYEVQRHKNGRVFAGHHGANRGWRALLAIEPAAGRALVALANADTATPVLDSVFSAWTG